MDEKRVPRRDDEYQSQAERMAVSVFDDLHSLPQSSVDALTTALGWTDGDAYVSHGADDPKTALKQFLRARMSAVSARYEDT